MSENVATAVSDKQRELAPDVSDAQMESLVAGNSAFAFDLYQALRENKGNLFYSPYSISLALAMTYAGARVETARQMAETLHFLLTPKHLHPAFNGLDLALAQRGKNARGKDGEGFRLNIVNALWGQDGHDFLAEFLDTLAENYGAGLYLLDFAGEPEASRLAINDWVSTQTEERITDLIPQGAIDPLTRLVLTNAIYFNAAWNFPFKEYLTADGPFHLPGGAEITVPMMQQTNSFSYGEGADYQALELPYDGRELSMLILLPAEGAFSAFEQSLTAGRVAAIIQDLKRRRVALTMPRYKFESAFQLSATLAAMGMPLAFSDSADFSGMDGGHTLFISDVIHKAFVAVDEAGTEAAAATAVIMVARAAFIEDEPIPVTLDRPFIFLIRDMASGSILFLGRVLDPGAS
jgi:serine protease inhibitor